MQKREGILNVLVQLGIGLVLFCFFSKLCPLVVFDCDDWMYLYSYRLPIPIWGGYEPTRVMPETLMPVAGWLAAHLVYPICGDYVYSVTVVSAVLITGMIVVMCVCLQKLLTTHYHLSLGAAVLLELLFLALFFLIFRNRGTSQCMFTAADLCCIYFYTMSGVLNAIVLLLFMRYDGPDKMFREQKVSVRVLSGVLLYFALFSNLFHSAMTAVYVFVHLVYGVQREYQAKSGFRQAVRKNRLCVLLLISYGLMLLFELSGGRADTVGSGTLDLGLAVRQLLAIMQALSKPFLLFLLVILSGLGVEFYKGRMNRKNDIVKLLAFILASGVLLTVFLLLLNAKCGYMSRIDASWGIWFYIIVFLVVIAAHMVKEYQKVFRWAPVILLFVIAASVYPDGKFSMSTREHTDYQTCVNLDQYMINCIKEADEKGLLEIIVKIPEHSDDLRSLTYNGNLGTKVAECLYAHGMIQNRIEVTTVPDKDMSDDFQIRDRTVLQ